MCMVSVISDYGRTRVPKQQWNPDTFSEYQQILRALQKLDAKLDQPDCESDDKTEWMREVEDRLAKLEGE